MDSCADVPVLCAGAEFTARAFRKLFENEKGLSVADFLLKSPPTNHVGSQISIQRIRNREEH